MSHLRKELHSYLAKETEPNDKSESANSPTDVTLSRWCVAGSLLKAEIGCSQAQPDSLQLGSSCGGMEGLLHVQVGLLLRLCQQACLRLGLCGKEPSGRCCQVVL